MGKKFIILKKIVVKSFFLLSMLLCTTKYLATDLIHINIDLPNNQLILDILNLSLAEASPKYQFIETPKATSIPRKIKMINNGTLSVMWAVTSLSLEKQLLAIKIPVFKGFFGYRLLVIREGMQQKYEHIDSLDKLKSFEAGQGTYWVDTKILKTNSLSVITADKNESLYKMLRYNRFDYFPRALHEPWLEIEKFGKDDFKIEDNIVLHYPSAVYFFVAKENKLLAKQIENGLNKSINDGSFDELFFNNALVKNALSKADLKNRTLIKLSNPYLPTDVPIDNKKYWMKLN